MKTQTQSAEGKTKQIIRTGEINLGLEFGTMRAKDDTTAHDDKRHELIEGKAAISTEMAANAFGLLGNSGIPVAFEKRLNEVEMKVPILTMILLEVVTRGIAKGSYLQRHPHVKDGQKFDKPIVEFHLKTKGPQWRGRHLGYDDPYMVIKSDGVELYDAHAPFINGTFFERMTLHEAFPIQETHALLPAIERLNFATFVILRHAWKLVGEKCGVDIVLADFKLEYGINTLGELMVGDVIDGDSCRILVNGEHKDKQTFRDDKPVEFVKQALAESAELSKHFNDHDIREKVEAWTRERFVFPRSVIPASRLVTGLEVWD